MNGAYAGAGPLPDPTITREAFSDRRPSARQAVPCFRGNSAPLGPTLVSRDRDATQEMIMNMFKMAAMLEANLANLDALTQGFSPTSPTGGFWRGEAFGIARARVQRSALQGVSVQATGRRGGAVIFGGGWAGGASFRR